MKKYLYNFVFTNPLDPANTFQSISGDRSGIVADCVVFCNKYGIPNNMTEDLIRNLFYFDKKRGVFPYKKPLYITSFSRELLNTFFKEEYDNRYISTLNASVANRRLLGLCNEYMINHYKNHTLG